MCFSFGFARCAIEKCSLAVVRNDAHRRRCCWHQATNGVYMNVFVCVCVFARIYSYIIFVSNTIRWIISTLLGYYLIFSFIFHFVCLCVVCCVEFMLFFSSILSALLCLYKLCMATKRKKWLKIGIYLSSLSILPALLFLPRSRWNSCSRFDCVPRLPPPLSYLSLHVVVRVWKWQSPLGVASVRPAAVTRCDGSESMPVVVFAFHRTHIPLVIYTSFLLIIIWEVGCGSRMGRISYITCCTHCAWQIATYGKLKSCLCNCDLVY